jgi:PIN domain nuclease of toxin-antitoxin system
MATLLDTQVLLWYVTADSRLSDRVREIVDAKSELFFSIASLWEIAIKLNIGKLQLTSSFNELLTRLAFIQAEILPIEIEDAQTYINLPLIPEHRDPFDRILVAQAMNRSMILASSDAKFDHYSIQRIWA